MAYAFGLIQQVTVCTGAPFRHVPGVRIPYQIWTVEVIPRNIVVYIRRQRHTIIGLVHGSYTANCRSHNRQLHGGL